MRKEPLAAILLISLPLLAIADPVFGAAADDLPVLGEISTPVLRPGESGKLDFSVTNRFDAKIRVSVTAEVYRYATVESSRPVAPGEPDAPFLCFRGRPREQCSTLLAIAQQLELSGRSNPAAARLVVGNLEVSTTAATPHGSLFDPSSYFVRFQLDYEYFQVTGNSSKWLPYRLLSRGHITDADWEIATKGAGLNVSYLAKIYSAPGRPFLGIVPDTSFVVREPIPQWPLYLLGGLALALGVLGVMLYSAETHGSFPWLLAALDRLTGKVRARSRTPRKDRAKEREMRTGGEEKGEEPARPDR